MQLHYKQLSQAEVERLAAELSLWIKPGMMIKLEGDLGSGKSTFARALLRALAGDEALDVPSPTFSLVQLYDETRCPSAHVDLYRLSAAAETAELGLEELLISHTLLVEWPDRLLTDLTPNVLALSFSGTGLQRDIVLGAHGAWQQALTRNAEIGHFLRKLGLGQRPRLHFDGDASARRYELLEGTPPLLVMDMPERPDGPAVKDGKPYSRIAHLAEGIGAVIAINSALRQRGFNAPEILHFDRPHGLAVLEYLPSSVYGQMVREGLEMEQPMQAATDVLSTMAGQTWPSDVSIADGFIHAIPAYDREALMVEVDLLVSWYWPFVKGGPMPAEVQSEFESIWADLLGQLDDEPRVWTLRDYHSPNLLWLPERAGFDRVGLIDTQDCVRGHPAYDLASLLQDARVDLDPALTANLLERYCMSRLRQEPDFDPAKFKKFYALLGSQRATKLLGIFVRLNKRDGKSAYLKHIPRVTAHLRHNLRHPALAPLAQWFATHLPLDAQ